MPADVQQLGKPCALEQVAGGSGDSSLKLGPQIGCRLDMPVDLFLGAPIESRYRQVRDMHGLKMRN